MLEGLTDTGTETTTDLKTYLREEYSNEKRPCDGEIYRKVRYYHSQGNFNLEWRWLSRFLTTGQRNYKQLLKHDQLLAALDKLMDIKGLWLDFKITTMHTIVAMKCEKVLKHQLSSCNCSSRSRRSYANSIIYMNSGTVYLTALKMQWNR